MEDVSRLHYEPEELAEFEGIESEWPLFLAFELVTACCEERWDDARRWNSRLQGLAVQRDGEALYPELYRVPDERVAAERQQPGSQPRQANTNLPLIWTQSLAWLGEMLLEGLVTPADLDPCHRRQSSPWGRMRCWWPWRRHRTPASRRSCATMAFPSVAAVRSTCTAPMRLEQAWAAGGANPRLGLSGLPRRSASKRRTPPVSTARASVIWPSPPPCWRTASATWPMTHCSWWTSVVDELHLLQRHWRGPGLPLLLIPINTEAFQHHPEAFLHLGRRLKSGSIDGIAVQFDTIELLQSQGQWLQLPGHGTDLESSIPQTSARRTVLREATDLADLTAAQEQELDETETDALRARLWASESLHEQAEVLELLQRRFGTDAMEVSPDD